MKLEVRLFATFRDGREKKYFLDLNEDTTPRHIVNSSSDSLGLGKAQKRRLKGN